MGKIYKLLVCPICRNKDIDHDQYDELDKEEYDNRTEINIKRIYNCYCNKCDNVFQVDYGKARLIRYKPYMAGANIDNIKLYVSYDSQFDRSYKIAEVNGVSMIIVEDDTYPIIIKNDYKDELINNHEEAKVYTYNTWMNRYR